MDLQDVIIRPVISERSMKDAAAGKFTFAVLQKATKKDVKSAVAKAFAVNVVGVATTRVKGKKKRYGQRRTQTQLPSWKRAVVKLKTGEKIPVFDVGGDKK